MTLLNGIKNHIKGEVGLALNILIVDDSTVMRKIIIKALSESRYHDAVIAEAADGLEGLKVFQPKKTNLILADWNMPNMNGIDFIRKVREIKVKNKIIVIMITTEGSTSKMEEAMNNGVDNYITKPFTSIQLEQKINKYFD
ncbi:MAG: response regulator [Actinobacteria bacterium]|nr:response regulator [Actinomycetota bacterium]